MPIILHIRRLYKIIYIAGNKIPKRDKLGLHQRIENIAVSILLHAINAALSPRQEKMVSLLDLRLKVEMLKHLIRLEHELKIIPEKTYLAISHLSEDISMMANGWLKSITQKSA